MIAKGKSITHLAASIGYVNRNVKVATVLDKNIASEDPAGVTREFKIFQNMNSRCQRSNLSFVISPTIEDGRKMQMQDLREVSQQFLREMKLNNHQYIAFVHEDTAHKHIHLYANRIDYQGKAYNDQFISNRAAVVAEKIALERGLHTARSIQAERSQKLGKQQEVATIRHISKELLRQKGVNSVEKFVDKFNKEGQTRGLQAEAYCNKAGRFQGLRFYAHGIKYKASEVDKSLRKQALEKTLSIKEKRMEMCIH